MPNTCRCGATDNVRVYPIWPRRLVLCRACATEHFKAQRRQDTGRLLAEYGDIDQAAYRAQDYHATLRASTVAGLVCTPQLLDDIQLCLDALAAQAVRYFRDFADQAYRVFPSYRDRQRARGHAARAVQRDAYQLAYDVPWLRRLYRDRCAYCATKAAHIDHLTPLALGGDDAPWNVAPACPACNLTKGARPLRDWLPGRLTGLPDEQRAAVRDRWHGWCDP